jgi:hypothetical protein
MTANLGQTNFTGGIFSRILDGQTNFAKYDNAVERMENFVIWPHGPATYRPGFKFVAEVKDSSKKTVIMPFEFSDTQAYIIEIGDLYFRFYKDKEQIESGASPYEVTHPYPESVVDKIKHTQSADVLYLFNKAYPSAKLSRTGDTSWVYQEINWNPGPMSDQDLEPATTLTLGAITGTNILFTAGASAFLAGDVGRIIKSGVGRASIISYTGATQVRCDIIDDFSAVGPISSGEWAMEGSPNSQLTPSIKEPKGAICNLTSSVDLFRSTDVGKFVRINSGVIKLTSYTNAQDVSGEILKVLSSTDASTSWTLEQDMWSANNGYPTAGTFFDDRLMLAGSSANPETVWGSVVGDYENHTPGIDDSDAVQFTIRGREVNIIRWIEPRDYLIIGTLGGEWRLGPQDIGDPLTPLNVVAKKITTKGCADIMPVTIDGSTLFVQRKGRKIRELAYDIQKGEAGGYSAPDLTQLAKDLTNGGIVDIAFQQEPFPTLWCAVDGGNLIGLTYIREQQVVAWHEHPMDNGEVESIAVIPGDEYDQLWAVIKRTIGGATKRYIEVMEDVFEDDAETYEANLGLNAFFVDSGITYNGAETSTITGLDHLERESVGVLADGAIQSDKTVIGGQITLSKAAYVVHVGLKYQGLIKPLRIDAQLQDGTAQARTKRVVDMFIRVMDSGVFKVGRDEDNLDTVQDPEISLVYGKPYPLFSGDLNTNLDDGYDRKGQYVIVQDKPMPLTVQAVYPETEIND